MRRKSADASCVFTLVSDADHSRVYLYNMSQRCFVVPKVGNSNSFWTTSTTQAYALAEVSASTTTASAYTIRGVSNSTNTYNYLNAYGGQNHTEVSAYTQADKGSQWMLVDVADQQYAFDITSVTEGKSDFVETVSAIPGVAITPSVSSIGSIKTNASQMQSRSYNLNGTPVSDRPVGLSITNGRKVFMRPCDATR